MTYFSTAMFVCVRTSRYFITELWLWHFCDSHTVVFVNLLAIKAVLCTKVTQSLTKFCRLVSMEDVKEYCHFQFLPDN